MSMQRYIIFGRFAIGLRELTRLQIVSIWISDRFFSFEGIFDTSVIWQFQKISVTLYAK